MDRSAAIPSESAAAGGQRDAAWRRARATPPPPGTYAPRLPPPTPETAPASGAAPVASDLELSPAAQRCLREIIELLDRATALLREHVGGAPAPAPLTPRLVAVELALAGHDRTAVRRRLASDLGLSDSGPVLDEVFGKGTPGHQRLPGAGDGDPGRRPRA